jgi:transcriptional regulator with XRE-family HTH domain
MNKPSKGVVMLVATGRSASDMARMLGEDRARVHDWIHGVKTPSISARHKLHKVFGIPATAWKVEREDATAPTVSLPTIPEPSISEPQTARAGIEAQLSRVRAMRRGTDDPSVILKLEEMEMKLLWKFGEMTGETNITPQQIRTAPCFPLLISNLTRWATNFPEASAALVQELEGFE